MGQNGFANRDIYPEVFLICYAKLPLTNDDVLLFWIFILSVFLRFCINGDTGRIS